MLVRNPHSAGAAETVHTPARIMGHANRVFRSICFMVSDICPLFAARQRKVQFLFVPEWVLSLDSLHGHWNAGMDAPGRRGPTASACGGERFSAREQNVRTGRSPFWPRRRAP